MVRVNVELDLPPGVELLGYERSGDGHGFEVKFSLPDSCRCDKCGHEDRQRSEGRVSRVLHLKPGYRSFRETEGSRAGGRLRAVWR
jgi:hypothetical protein